MKYRVFLSDSIDILKNEHLLGGANTYQEACTIIRESIPKAANNPCWRILMAENATFIDYGSWSKFAAIVPPVPQSVITGADTEE